MKHSNTVTQWPACNAYQRANDCAFFLFVHGFLSEMEFVDVCARLKEWKGSGFDSFAEHLPLPMERAMKIAQDSFKRDADTIALDQVRERMYG